MRNWKKRLNEELNNIVPELREDVKKAPIVTAEEKKPSIKERFLLFFSQKTKRIISVALSFVLVFVLALATMPLFNAPRKEEVVIVEINPKVAFAFDKNGVVTQVSSLNVDGDVILQNEENIETMKGKNVKEAIKSFIDSAFKLNYLKENGAVKISGLEEFRYTTAIKESVEDYFCDKGLFAVVLTQKLEEKEFCEQIGVKTGSSKDILKTIYQTQLFSERDSNKGNLNALYDDLVDVSNLYTGVKNKIDINKQQLHEYKQCVLEIERLNDLIINSEENLGIEGLNDYWSIKKGFYIGKLSQSFEMMVGEMETLLNDFYQKYGKNIESVLELHTIKNEILIAESIFDSTGSEFIKDIGGVLNVLKTIGLEVDYLVNLFTTPETFEDYLTKIDSYYQLKIENGYFEYDKVREKFNKDDYLDKVAKIIEEYGNLENYWESLN